MLSLIRFTAVSSCSGVLSVDLLRSKTDVICQQRGRKRALKKTVTRQQKLERRMKREEKEAVIILYNLTYLCIETLIIYRSKVKTQFYSISEALAMHRELQHPAIYDNLNALVRLRLELNMNTERQVYIVS
uniref:DDE_Tnp_1_7 domain-containing protein n=1 Tax=Heterorhabditis bacteriophora TaxID=37862 RepID=A0A1I7W680_HETBA